MKKRILVIDDDMDTCYLLSRFLTKKGYEVDVTVTAEKGIEKFKEQKYDVVICDFRLGGKKDGKDVLMAVKKEEPSTIVLIITGYSDIRIAVDITKEGAYDYISKPLIPEEVLNVVQNALADHPTVYPVNDKPPTKKRQGNSEEFLTGVSGIMQGLYQQVDVIAPTNLSVILYGESGTGKEVIAKSIHNKSNRKDNPFVAMDCGTLSKELSGSELFGHVKGSFTGAFSDKAGHFELANGGTLFLDEVANISMDIQASLLRVIQERKIKKIGGTKEIDVDVRIIVASNENLKDAYEQGRFREDLYHRFNEFSIDIPPLRNRKEDIPLFACFFLNNTNIELDKELEGFEDGIMDMFIKYSWPGNIRELRNVIRRAVLLTHSGKVSAHSLPAEITSAIQPLPVVQEAAPDPAPVRNTGLKDTASKAEYEVILDVLKTVNFNKSKAAIVLGINRKTLYNKMNSQRGKGKKV